MGEREKIISKFEYIYFKTVKLEKKNNDNLSDGLINAEI
jgi:hypothetical protein